MRHLYSALLLLSSTFSVFAQQGNNGYVIKGTVKGLETGTVYLMYKDDDGKTHNEQGTVANGQFVFKGSVTEPRHCYISTSSEIKPGEFFIENSNITLSFDKGTPDKLMVKGSSATDLYASFQNSEKDVVKEYAALEGIYFNAIQQDNKQMLQSADSIKVGLNTRHREYLKSFCAANPKSPVAEYLVLRALEFDHDFTSISSIFAQLDPSLTNNAYGKLIAGKLQGVKEVATDKSDSDFDPHAH